MKNKSTEEVHEMVEALFAPMKEYYAILRGDIREPDAPKGRSVEVNGKSVYVRTDFGILLETLAGVTQGYLNFIEIYYRYCSLEGDNHLERLFKSVQMDDTVPLAIVRQKFESNKRSHEDHYRKHGIIRGESGISGDIGLKVE